MQIFFPSPLSTTKLCLINSFGVYFTGILGFIKAPTLPKFYPEVKAHSHSSILTILMKQLSLEDFKLFFHGIFYVIKIEGVTVQEAEPWDGMEEFVCLSLDGIQGKGQVGVKFYQPLVLIQEGSGPKLAPEQDRDALAQPFPNFQPSPKAWKMPGDRNELHGLEHGLSRPRGVEF